MNEFVKCKSSRKYTPGAREAELVEAYKRWRGKAEFLEKELAAERNSARAVALYYQWKMKVMGIYQGYGKQSTPKNKYITKEQAYAETRKALKERDMALALLKEFFGIKLSDTESPYIQLMELTEKYIGPKRC